MGALVCGAVPLDVAFEFAFVALKAFVLRSGLVARVPKTGVGIARWCLLLVIPVFNSDKPIGVGPEIQLGGEEIALVFPTGNINPLRARRRWYRRCLSFSARRRSSWSRWNRD